MTYSVSDNAIANSLTVTKTQPTSVFSPDLLTIEVGRSASSLLFVDTRVSNYQQIVASAQTGTEVYILEATRDAIGQITDVLLGRSGISALHILSHGEVGELDFASSTLSLANLSSYTSQLKSWRNALTAGADILLYGCNVAHDALGQAFVRRLADATGADVAASSNLTGSTAGDWTLEVKTGEITTTTLVDNDYQQALDAIRLTSFDSFPDPSNPSNLTNVGGTLFFRATDSTGDTELWKSDGTEVGTVRVKDINSVSSSIPSSLTVVGNTLFFSAIDNSIYNLYGYRGLWKTDGTEAGTVLVKGFRDISTALYGVIYNPPGWGVMGNTIFFNADDGVSGYELWKSDGTEAGTVRVKDINPGYSSANPSRFTIVGNTLFFTAADSTGRTGLWKSDGSEAGTVRVKDVDLSYSSYSGYYSGSINYGTRTPGKLLANIGTTLFFSAADNTGGYELWKSDGTETGTVRVKDINPGSNSSSPYSLTNVGDTLFFTAIESTGGNELWKSDGTEAGTVRVKDINPGSSSSYVSYLINVGNTLFFSADNGTTGNVLWRSDGTEAGTIRVKDVYASKLANFGGTLFFNAYDSISGSELWKSDGTEAGTVRVKDIIPGFQSSAPDKLTNVGGTLFFNAYDSVAGQELWKSDGTAAGTVLVKDINRKSIVPPGERVTIGTTSYFTATESKGGSELWKTDGTVAGTVRVKDINLGVGGSRPTNLTNVGGTLFFSATDSTGKASIWKSDGTEAGTIRVKDIYSELVNYYSTLGTFISANGTLFFTISDRNTQKTELWKSNGTETGTVRVKDINFLNDGSYYFTSVGSTLFFTSTDSASNRELWKSDGTEAGTVRVKPIPNAFYFTSVGNTLFFRGYDSIGGEELWKSDGTEAGTVRVKDINPGSGSSSPVELINVGGTLFFKAYDPIGGYELWRSDGTEAGTVRVKDIIPGSLSSAPSYLNSVGSTLFFTATDSSGNPELWKSDGTEAGTVRLVRSNVWLGGAKLGNFTTVKGKIYFLANNGIDGPEVWTTDGTEAGTFKTTTANLGAGATLRNPSALGETNGELLLIATDPINGTQLWKASNLPNNTNHAPSFTGNAELKSLLEESMNSVGLTIDQLFRSLFSDIDAGSSLGGVAVISNTANAITQGSWQYSTGGTTWFNIAAVADNFTALALSATTVVRFVPVANYNGTPTPLTVRALDNTQTTFTNGAARVTVNSAVNGGASAIAATPNTITINITPVNDAPSFIKGANQTVTAGDALQTIPQWATGLVTGPPDEVGQTATYQIVSNSNPDLFSVAPTIAANGTLSYQPISTLATTTIITLRVMAKDNGGTANGGIDTSAVQTFTITIGSRLNPRRHAQDVSFQQLDFTGDGKADILWRNELTGENVIWEMDGATQTAAVYLPTVDKTWSIATIADFDGNGQGDLLWRNSSTKAVVIWRMKGTAIADQAYLATNVGAEWQVIGSGDFNGDGKADLLWRNTTTGENVVWALNGVQQIDGYYLTSVADQAWQVSSIGDFNGDGKADLVWSHKTSYQTVLWQLNRATLLAQDFIGAGSAGWAIAATGDFNGDGKADLLWRNAKTGENVVWQMNGNTIAQANYITKLADADWQVATVGDVDRDGKTDLIWRNYRTGDDAIWTMNGLKTKVESAITKVNDFNWDIG